MCYDYYMPNYPASPDTFPGTTAQGGSLLTAPDHAADHRLIGSSLNIIENTVLGTTAGTSVLKQFATGDFAARINSSNVPQQLFSNGTINNPIIGTPAITGGTDTNTVINTPTIGTPNITGGTATSMTLGTPTVDVIGARNSGTAIVFADSIAPQVGTIVDAAGGTYAVNAQANQIYYSVMGTSAGNRTIGTPSSPTPYQQLTYAFKSSGSANGTLVWTAIHRISQAVGTPVLGTGVGWNYFGWRYNPLDTKWDFVGQSITLV